MPKDFRGQELEVGDTVVYVSGGRHTTRIIAEVIEIKKKVKVISLAQDRTPLAYPSHLDPGMWVQPYNCFAVDKFKGE